MLLNTFSFGEDFPIRGSDYRNKIILLSNLKIYIWLARGWTRGWTFKKSNSFQVAEVLPTSLRSPTAKHLRQRLYDVTQWARMSAKNVKCLIYFFSANKSHLSSKKGKIGIEMFCVLKPFLYRENIELPFYIGRFRSYYKATKNFASRERWIISSKYQDVEQILRLHVLYSLEWWLQV